MSVRRTVSGVVNALLKDLAGRAGLGDEWDQIEADIQEEIKREWERIVEEKIT